MLDYSGYSPTDGREEFNFIWTAHLYSLKKKLFGSKFAEDVSMAPEVNNQDLRLHLITQKVDTLLIWSNLDISWFHRGFMEGQDLIKH